MKYQVCRCYTGEAISLRNLKIGLPGRFDMLVLKYLEVTGQGTVWKMVIDDFPLSKSCLTLNH